MRDGKTRTISTRKTRFTDNNGKKFLVGVIRDITEQKLAEKALRESEKRYSSLVENIPGACYRCILDNDWTMLFISDNIEKISGFPASDFIQNRVRTYSSIMYPEDAIKSNKIAMDAVNRKESYTIEYRIVKADGDFCWVFERSMHIR